MDIYGSFWSIISDDIEMDRAVFDNLEMDLRTFSSLKEIVWKLDIDIYVLLIKMKGENYRNRRKLQRSWWNVECFSMDLNFDYLILMHVIRFLNFTIFYQLAITIYNFGVCTLIIRDFLHLIIVYTVIFKYIYENFLAINSTMNNLTSK